MDLDAETSWGSQTSMITNQFAVRCRELCNENALKVENPLAHIMSDLMTEFWDMGFSQTEIREAFFEAPEGMNQYAAGEERRT